VLKKHADMKPGDKKDKDIDIFGSSKLFDIYYMKDGKTTGIALSGDEKVLMSAITTRVIAHEADPIQKSMFDLARLPAHFRMPDKFKGLLTYDAQAKQLCYKGIMTKEDKAELFAFVRRWRVSEGAWFPFFGLEFSLTGNRTTGSGYSG